MQCFPSHPQSFLSPCTKYGYGGEALFELGKFLDVNSAHRLSNSPSQGSCFILSASSTVAATISKNLDSYRLSQFVLWPSVLKLAPGLLDHEADPVGPSRLSTTYGYRTRLSNVRGLEVELSPGILHDHTSSESFVVHLQDSLMSNLLDLRDTSFSTNSKLFHSSYVNHRTIPATAKRALDWSTAADLVHDDTSKDRAARSPGNVCSWEKLLVRRSSGSLIITGESSSIWFLLDTTLLPPECASQYRFVQPRVWCEDNLGFKVR